MPNTEKVAAVAEIVEHFTNSSAAVITEYRGMTVAQIQTLRRQNENVASLMPGDLVFWSEAYVGLLEMLGVDAMPALGNREVRNANECLQVPQHQRVDLLAIEQGGSQSIVMRIAEG